jgi:ligand-binding sensor domain-containing protein
MSKLTKMPIHIILLFIILTTFTACRGQSQNTHHIAETPIQIGDTVSELAKTIWIIFQDRNNHYWFGSDGNGVYRYDGKTILHFSTQDGLLNDRIRGIQEDKLGDVFITSLEGINKFDGQKMTTLPAIESNEWKLDSNDLWFSVLGKTGANGPYRYDGKTLHQLKFPKHHMEDEHFKINGKRPWSPYEPYAIYKDSKGNIWFGTSEFGICRYDGLSLSWMYEKHLTLIEGGGSFGIRSILEDKEGKFWFCNTSYRYTILPGSVIEQDKILIDYKREK